jgi:hypothetical protein
VSEGGQVAGLRRVDHYPAAKFAIFASARTHNVSVGAPNMCLRMAYLIIHQLLPLQQLPYPWSLQKVVIRSRATLGLTLRSIANEFANHVILAPVNLARFIRIEVCVALVRLDEVGYMHFPKKKVDLSVIP